MIRRMMGAARLHPEIFEEVEEDSSSTIQALTVVVLVAIASGVGNLDPGDANPVAFGLGILSGIVGWAVWAWVAYFVGTKVLGTTSTHADWGQLARAMGFAQSPGVFKVFGFIPVIGPVIFFLAHVWQLIAMVVAIRQALDYHSTWRAVGVVAIGFIAYLVFASLVLFLI